MKTMLKLAPAAALLLILTGCATGDKKPATQAAGQTQQQAAQPQVEFDRKTEVAYNCGNKGQDKVRVMYGLKGDDVVAAQVLFQQRVSPVMVRDGGDANNNVFRNNGFIWVANKASAANVSKVGAKLLGQTVLQTVDGKQNRVEQVVTQNCKLDVAGTRKLQAAK